MLHRFFTQSRERYWITPPRCTHITSACKLWMQSKERGEMEQLTNERFKKTWHIISPPLWLKSFQIEGSCVALVHIFRVEEAQEAEEAENSHTQLAAQLRKDPPISILPPQPSAGSSSSFLLFILFFISAFILFLKGVYTLHHAGFI